MSREFEINGPLIFQTLNSEINQIDEKGRSLKMVYFATKKLVGAIGSDC